jgi:hypothetical protein
MTRPYVKRGLAVACRRQPAPSVSNHRGRRSTRYFSRIGSGLARRSPLCNMKRPVDTGSHGIDPNTDHEREVKRFELDEVERI